MIKDGLVPNFTKPKTYLKKIKTPHLRA